MENLFIKNELNPVESGYFEMQLPIEESGIFRQGWTSDELDAITVICTPQSDVENSALAVIAINGKTQAMLKRVYKKANCIVLEAPKNLDKPNELIPPIILTIEEAKETLSILGKVVKFVFTIKSSSEAAV